MFDRPPLLLSIAALLVLVIASNAAAQGDSGFLRGKGKLDLSLTYGLDTYDEFWIGGDKVSDPPFGRVTRQYFSLYGAYGLTDEIDLNISAAYVYVDTDSIFDDESDFQDLTLQLKARLTSLRLGPGTLNVLAEPGIKVPLTHYEDDNVNAIGDGQVDLRARGIVQYVFDDGTFIALEAGYDFRFNDPPDEFPINLTAGFTVDGTVTISGFLSYVSSLGGYDIGEGPFPGVEEEYLRVGGNVYWRVNERFGLSVSGWTTIDGRNTGDVDGFSIGTVFHF